VRSFLSPKAYPREAGGKGQAIFWALKQGLVRLNIDAALVGNVDEGGQ
jgi:LuxR family transcriptional regulator, quorum-sensing system regulator SolR